MAELTVERKLRRHELRRRDGLPTVSVLVGDASLRYQELERFVSASGAALVVAHSATAAALAHAWFHALPAPATLLGRALSAAQGEHDVAGLSADWHARSARERALFLEQLSARAPDTRSLSAVRWLAVAADDPVGHSARGPLAALHGVSSWLMRSEWPVLCVNSESPAALTGLLTLTSMVPELFGAAVLSTRAFEQACATLDARGRALLIEGVIDEASTPQRPSAPPRRANPIATLRDQALAAHAAARTLRENDSSEAEAASTRARNLAALLLYEMLQVESSTRDRFELDRILPFELGPHASMVDLVCMELKLALELDGCTHLRDRDAYRRDQHKEVLLQCEGFVVQRVLAEDVIERGESIVRAVCDLVKRRTRSLV